MGRVGDQMRQDLAQRGYAIETQRSYWKDARRLAKRYMKPPTEIGRDELREYVSELSASGVSASRLKRHFAALKFLYEKTLGRPTDVSFISWPKQPRPLPRVLSQESVMALLGALQTPKYRAIVMVMYGAGLRIKEACALEVSDIDAARAVIHVRHGRGTWRVTSCCPRCCSMCCASIGDRSVRHGRTSSSPRARLGSSARRRCARQ